MAIINFSSSTNDIIVENNTIDSAIPQENTEYVNNLDDILNEINEKQLLLSQIELKLEEQMLNLKKIESSISEKKLILEQLNNSNEEDNSNIEEEDNSGIVKKFKSFFGSNDK